MKKTILICAAMALTASSFAQKSNLRKIENITYGVQNMNTLPAEKWVEIKELVNEARNNPETAEDHRTWDWIGRSALYDRQIMLQEYQANGNKFKDAHKIALGYLAGDIWALIAFEIMAHTPLNPDLTLFLTLAVFGFILVIISDRFKGIIHMPSWLTGWAIGMLTMNLDTTTAVMSLTVQIAFAMLVGVYYVGALLDLVHRSLNK